MVDYDLDKVLEMQQQAYRSAVEMIFSTVNTRLHEVEKNYHELTAFYKYTEKDIEQLKQENKAQREEIVELKKTLINDRILKLEEQCNELNRRVDYQDDYSRRNNIRIEGLTEDAWEKWEATEEKVKRLLRDTLDMGDVQLERAHRVGAANHGAEAGTAHPRTIIARFEHVKDRDLALRCSAKLKNTNIFLNEDLCQGSLKVRMSKMAEFKKARAEGKIAYFRHTRLITHDRSGPSDARRDNQQAHDSTSDNGTRRQTRQQLKTK